MNEIILSTQNGEPVASSRQIAENFEKRHDHVMRDIDTFKKDVPNFGEMKSNGKHKHLRRSGRCAERTQGP